MRMHHALPARALRHAGIWASWGIFFGGAILLILMNAPRWWTPVWLLLSFAPYLLTLNVLEPWLTRRGLVREDHDDPPLA